LYFWDFDRPLPGGASYREELVREIELFNQKFPNITVELKLFPWTHGEQVAAAIRRRQEVPHILSLGPLEAWISPATYYYRRAICRRKPAWILYRWP